MKDKKVEIEEEKSVMEEKNGFMEERLSALFQPDALITDEFFGNYRRRISLEPEKALLLAVLEDGIRSFQENLLVESGKKRALFEEAREWIFIEDSDRIFSFNSICSGLGMNPQYIRRGLRRWEEHARNTADRNKQSSRAIAQRLVA